MARNQAFRLNTPDWLKKTGSQPVLSVVIGCRRILEGIEANFGQDSDCQRPDEMR